MLKWLKYSGASIIFTINPYHWRYVPQVCREINNEWPSPNERTWKFTWLGLTIRIWIDDGSW